jgi:cyclase
MSQEISERPASYVGPNLNPAGLSLCPEQLGNGVYALMANEIPKDNNGVVFGEKWTLVVDAGINGAVASQIQELARSLSNKPVGYLVNTTYHGDHTFGNAAFPADVTIVSSSRNKESMSDLSREKAMRSKNLRGNVAALDEVTAWRKPDITFDDHLTIDLGGTTVELWYFGPGNAPGDTVVYVPSVKAAWTGNYLMAAGIPPMLLEGGAVPYIESLKRMASTLDVDTVVPGHGPMGAAKPAIENFIGYLSEIHRNVADAVANAQRLDDILGQYPSSRYLHPPEGTTPTPSLGELMPHLHRLNVMAEYKALTSADRS